MQTNDTLFYLNDPSFVTLSAAVDLRRMAAQFEAWLCQNGTWRIADCRLERLRYRRAVRCILQYELRLQHTKDDVECVVRLAGYLYADKAKLLSRQRRLRALCRGETAPGALPRHTLFDSLDMLVARFPLDYGNPVLHTSFDEMPAVLHTHRTMIFGSDAWRISKLHLEPVRWRVGLCAVLRAHVHATHENGAKAECRLYIKIAPKRHSDVKLPALVASAAAPFRIAETVARDVERGMEIQRAAAGTPLLDLLMEHHAGRREARRLGEVLAAWHLDGLPPLRQLTFDDLKLAMERVAQILTAVVPSLRGALYALLDDIQEQWIDGPAVSAHLDLKPDHVFFEGDDVVFIDLASAASADPALDLARLLARLSCAQALHGIPERYARGFAVEVHDTYRARVPAVWLRNLPVCYAWSLLQCAASVFEHQQPGWPDRVIDIVHTAMAVDLSDPAAPARLLAGKGSTAFAPLAMEKHE